jgi:hypothetical protein
MLSYDSALVMGEVIINNNKFLEKLRDVEILALT